MKRILCMALLSTIAMLLITACGRREPVDEEVEYEVTWANGVTATVGSLTMPGVEEIHENLALLGKVWGFAKYHHPVFLTGRLCWDLELLSLIPPVLDGGDVREILYDWFVGLGKTDYDFPYGVYFNLVYLLKEIEGDIYGQATDGVFEQLREFLEYFNGMEPDWPEFVYIMEDRFPDVAAMILVEENDLRPIADLSWISYENLGALANQMLRFRGIRVVGRSGAPVRFHFLWNAARFSNQDFREFMDISNSAERLLALFRLWNAVNYYFAHLDALDADWNGLLLEFVPKMMEGEDRFSYEVVLASLVHHLQDAAFPIGGVSFWRHKFGEVFVPVLLTTAEGRLVVYEVVSDGVPLQRGDAILSVDGLDISELVNEMKPYMSFPSDEKALAFLAGQTTSFGWIGAGWIHPLTSHERFMDIEVLRGRFGMSVNVMGSRNSIMLQPRNIESHVLLDENIGLINPSVQEDVHYIMDGFQATYGLIIDLRGRGWPQQDFLTNLMQYLLEEPLPFMYLSHPSQVSPGSRFNSLYETPDIPRSPYAFIYDRPVVLLMDESINASSENIIMTLRTAPNVTVMGTSSLGHFAGASFLPMPGRISMHIRATGIYTPEGGRIFREGIVPDITVERTIQGIAEGIDETMEYAIRFILGDG